MLTKNGRPFVQLETQLIMQGSKILITDTNKHHVLHYKENPLFFFFFFFSYECNSVKFKKSMYDGCQSSSAPPSIFSQNQQEMPDIFSVVNSEYTACYCSTTEQYILSHTCRCLSKRCGMVICLLNNGLSLNFL
jgi:hypothetical protein